MSREDEQGQQWVVFRTVYDPTEAAMIKDLLESGGIDVIVRSSKVTPYPVNIGRMGEVKILIRSSDLEEARKIIPED
ncbi:MAG TPA: hypothetical protein ENK09_00005 [Nitrospirae bacterium]|nr:hypothetical protein [Nitrospirota bacterium]